MLDAPKPFFFRGRHQHAVLDEGSRRVGMEGIDAKDNHVLFSV
jgi:hypothetical protein